MKRSAAITLAMVLLGSLLVGIAPAWAAQAANEPIEPATLTDDADDVEATDPETEGSNADASAEAAADEGAGDAPAPEEEAAEEPASEDEAVEESADEEAAEEEASTENSRDGPANEDDTKGPRSVESDFEIAAATPVYEIKGRWVDQPDTISRGNPVVGEWRINVNDDEEPPSNDPVDNVTATFTVDKAFFDEIPDMCLTDGVDPASSLSADGTELTCNFGTVNMGTAIVLQTPVVANGITGEEVVLDGTSPGGETVELDPIPIDNPFIMDIHYGTNTGFTGKWNDDFTHVDVDVQWSLRLGNGSDPGPDEVTYRLTVADLNGGTIELGPHPVSGELGCSPYDLTQLADGHPWSRSDIPPEHRQNTSFVDECILTPVAGQPGEFDLTLRGINYDLLNVPTHDSTNRLLPPEWDYVASGTLWFRVHTTEAGSITLESSAPTYEAPTGQEYDDPADNNTTNKVYTLPGNWSAYYQRSYTGSGGTPWDDTYRVSAGTTVMNRISSRWFADDVPPDSEYGSCLPFDTRFVTLEDPSTTRVVASNVAGGRDIDTIPVEYYVGNDPRLDPNSGQYNPHLFNCGGDAANWITTPQDPSAIKAVRILYPHQQYADENAETIQLFAFPTINDDVPVGQDVWMFGSTLRDGVWAVQEGPRIETPGARYPYTTSSRDMLRIIGAVPYIEKDSAQATVTPGVPSEFTLMYMATGAGAIPDTVDGYEIVDTLPLGMTYEPGSADPEPVVTTDAQGRQVLTWTLDGVATNTENTLTYQAVADTSIEPGTQLTNTAVSSYDGESSREVTETVTTTTNGYTIILKTADVEYIPNREGDGVGTGSWTVAIESNDPIAQAFTDTIDILPYNGDQRGTSFNGTYTLDDVVLNDGGTVYYTDADPATLSDDPEHPDNGAPNAPSALWTTDRPENPTAVRVIGGELLSGGTFSFQVVITTDGAEPQDVYVNRAQARAEHTELVMRTSAVLIVTDYLVEKTSDPEPGSVVAPGDVVTYTVTVTQQGEVPAGAVFRDDLSDVLDDAIYNDDVAADIGDATFEDGILYWEGDIPVGGTATITYSVTIKDIEGLEADGDTIVDNVVWSPGCPVVEEGEDDPCNPPPVYVGWYDYSKTAVPTPGSTVQLGDVITYNVEITQRGEGAIEGAIVTDDLTEVLDDAVWDDNVEVSSGEVSYEEPILTWTGDLDVGDVVTLTYTVTVDDVGDYELTNVVSSPDEERSRCVPAPDENPDCTTTHIFGDYEVEKTSDPESGSAVEPGDVITYTVEVRHVGLGPLTGSFEDDMSQVLDDAVYNDDAEASAGGISYDEPVLSWVGDLEVDDVVTVTYSVTVTAEGDRFLKNVVTTDGQCVPAEGQDEACTTEHINGAYTFSKTADPEPGSLVEAGEVVTYTVEINHIGTAPVEGAIVEDDLSDVLDDATWNDDAEASSGDVSLDDTTLTWTGDLDVGQVVTVTYSVTVGDEMGASLLNVVTSPDGRGVCVPAPDENPDCTTEHFNAAYTYSKTSDPESGSEVKEGDVVTYTVLIEHIGEAPVEGATVTDDLSEVSNVAKWNDDAKASSGEITREGTTLTWTGDLEVGEVVTLTYSVTVGDSPNATMRNVVTSDDDRAACVPAEDGNADCTTEHNTPEGEEPPGKEPPRQPTLPDTGSGLAGWVLIAGLVLLFAGLSLAATTRRRTTVTGGPTDTLV
ncbi:DUF11 domain-containing protein [Phytoactinopolyspora mesophila]|uniref:DUF11 domain-containing protein n=1 Tax=Phytoactinopolyspora mesophila TaxID=2650750 RepID=A0A7K3M5V9_9ACTN|nr:DUF11 domain-containing protein [Phytoactinopolyspora mesophila]NDL58600.1 DUF11 domain-containing protein [Phytoactinopolyspora mesophila]